MYSSYTAASFAREYELADSLKVNFMGAVSWSFEFENQPWFYGFRDLATNGVDKPVLNVFRMFGMMKGKRVQVKGNQMYTLHTIADSSVRGVHTDIGALATKDKRTAAVMIWNYHDDDIQNAGGVVNVQVNDIPGKVVTITQYLIDHEHSNSYELWKKMGSPQTPSEAQIQELEKAGQLQITGKPEKKNVANGSLQTEIMLPRQGVCLLKLDW
jgi:xylan 1,4-beta-xylosidase